MAPRVAHRGAQEPRCIVVGDVMTDVLVKEKAPFAARSDTASTITVCPGGSAANQAVWMARSGIDVHLVGAIGDDELGASSLRSLESEGVQAHLTEIAGAQSGIVVALVDLDGRRSMLTDRGANLHLGECPLADALFRAGDHLHLSGYELLDTPTRSAARALLARARAAKMTISVDANSAAPLKDAGAEAFLSWTEGCECCCSNLDEARVLTGREDPKEAARALAAHFGEVVVTVGASGAVWAKAGEEPTSAQSVASEVVDTTGAGDAFIGAFLATWLRHGDRLVALGDGLDAAALAVASVGARSSR